MLNPIRSLTKLPLQQVMAEREGFEPSVGVNLHTLSRRAPSANSATSPFNIASTLQAKPKTVILLYYDVVVPQEMGNSSISEFNRS